MVKLMNNNLNQLITHDVSEYYTSKLKQFGETPQGVDWNGEESQSLRFQQLCKIITTSSFSLNDLGCGYGALYDYLESKYKNFSYTGVDVSGDMVKAAQQRYKAKYKAQFVHAGEPSNTVDYGIASGIFNVRLGRLDEEWLSYLKQTLDMLDQTSSLGFAFNCLTSYSDDDKMRDYLYYADPCFLFDLCKRRYSNNVALLHDYNLYEFTILVRK
jgi:SAM-dependent methyltransferase